MRVVTFGALIGLAVFFDISVVRAEAAEAQQSRGFALEHLMMPGKLSQAHAKYENECAQCHSDFDDAAQTGLCRDCHEDIDADLRTETGFHGRLPDSAASECRSCHSDHLGREADIVGLESSRFNHKQTDFGLLGAHREVACDQCHVGDLAFREAPSDCFSCHQDNDVHSGGMGQACGDCHDSVAWAENRFDHSDTSFLLKGAHSEVSCAACHPDQQYENTPDQCAACHQLSDVHQGLWGSDCAGCHAEEAWDDTRFDHAVDTDFELLGHHAKVPCGRCHTEAVAQQDLRTDCHGCHQADDVHLGANGDACDECHNAKAWRETDFNHDQDTDFPLLGSHGTISCESCHANDEQWSSGLKTEGRVSCVDCHDRDDYHSGGMGASCDSCHAESTWGESIRFNHALTAFPLAGMHGLVSCDGCHSAANRAELSVTCGSCHEQESPHEEAYGDDCAACHNPAGWNLWLFDHNKQTDYPLEGVHEQLACADCHGPAAGLSNAFETDQFDCYACHRKDDRHRRRFGTDCGRCHIPETFRDIRVQRL